VIPEGLPLGGEVAITRGNAEEEGVVFFELVRGDEGDGLVLPGSVHFAEDFLGESLFDSVWVIVNVYSSKRWTEAIRVTIQRIFF